MKKMLCSGLVLMLAMFLSVSDSEARERKVLIDEDWCFSKSEDFSDFVMVDLPHDWSIEGVPSPDEPSGNDGGYRPTGKGWYRKTVSMAKDDLTKRHSLYFEGVYMNAEVLVNGHSMGIHHYGYSSFIHDVTQWLQEAARVIAVGNGDVKETGCTLDKVHNAWKGRALSVVRASDTSGKVTVKFTSPGLKPARTRISVTF